MQIGDDLDAEAGTERKRESQREGPMFSLRQRLPQRQTHTGRQSVTHVQVCVHAGGLCDLWLFDTCMRAIACMRLHTIYPRAATCLDVYAQITDYKQQKLEEEERRVSKEIEDKKLELGELDEKYASAKAKEGQSGCCDVSVTYRCASALNVREQFRRQLCPFVISVS